MTDLRDALVATGMRGRYLLIVSDTGYAAVSVVEYPEAGPIFDRFEADHRAETIADIAELDAMFPDEDDEP